MPIDGDATPIATSASTKSKLKRKRAGFTASATTEEREAMCKALEDEMEGLFRYYKEVLEVKVDGMDVDCGGGMSVNGMIACLMEESSLPLSKLVEYVFGRLKECGGVAVGMGGVKSSVVLLGQRIGYGVLNVDADVLEDELDECLWCWETRDLKVLPRSARMVLKVRRTCRKKIHERITAVCGFLSALRNPEIDVSTKIDLTRRSEKLCKVLNEADIRLLVDSMIRKNDTELSQKETNKEEKLIVKQLERNKRELEKEKKKMDREMMKEKLLHEKEQKRLQEEAERRQEKDENELKKQQKRLQDEAEREQRRREKEDNELKKQIALKKQASLMERFVKKSRTDCINENDISSANASYASSSITSCQQAQKPVIQLMDDALSQITDISATNLQMSHMASWRKLGESVRTTRNQHWGLRRKPKTELVKEIKLSSCEDLASGNEQTDIQLPNNNEDFEAGRKIDADALKFVSGNQKAHHRKQLLQFDKSFRPAFYGVWPKQSNVIGPRHPFKKDPELDYDVDSDEEWEEEEPGESLSDCEKDADEESLESGIGKAEEEDESEDGFFVPDGYLSDSEGVQDRMEPDISVEDVSSSCQLEESEELHVLIRHQKYLKNLTDHSLRKNQPLFISNMMHEKAPLLNACDLSGLQKVEQMCLQALSMCLFPGHSQIEISIGDEIQEDDVENDVPNSKANATSKPVNSVISDVDLPKFVTAIQCGSQGMSKIIEGLQPSFPSVPKSLLKSKVRQLSDFVDNRWQVKREVLDDLGLAPCPVKNVSAETPPTVKGRIKKKITITTFFSKRCMPPSETKTTNINPNEVSPEPPKKIARTAYFEPQLCKTNTADEP